MAFVKFYEKTGCINNTKQKKLLELAGHTVEAINMIEYNWTAAELIDFLEGIDLEKCFNMNAPTISSGHDKPSNYNKKTVIQAMLKNPLLIKRPLLEIGDIKMVGFDKDVLDALIGLKPTGREMKDLMNQNLEICPQKLKNASCD